MSIKYVIVKRKLGVVLYLGQAGWVPIEHARTYSGQDFAQNDRLNLISASVRPDVTIEVHPHTVENATFHSFKPSGKWYATGRGHLSPDAFSVVFDKEARVHRILKDNDGKWPGLGGRGDEFTLVVFGDDNVDYGWPLMFPREKW